MQLTINDIKRKHSVTETTTTTGETALLIHYYEDLPFIASCYPELKVVSLRKQDEWQSYEVVGEASEPYDLLSIYKRQGRQVLEAKEEVIDMLRLNEPEHVASLRIDRLIDLYDTACNLLKDIARFDERGYLGCKGSYYLGCDDGPLDNYYSWQRHNKIGTSYRVSNWLYHIGIIIK